MEKNKSEIIADLKAKFEEKELIARKFSQKNKHINVYQIGEYIPFVINKAKNISEIKKEMKFGVNWCAMGTTNVVDTKTFIKELQNAIKLCEKLNED